MLRIDALSAAYGRIKVLWDVSLNVGDGEAVGLFGPNGAGKTTLVNCVMGFLKPVSGKVLFQERNITGMEPHQIVKLGIALVPQERELFPNMTVEENLRAGANYIPHARERIGEAFDLVFTLFPVLKERIRQKVGTMSGGQQRMVAVARALMSFPKLLILDEPSVGLQPSIVSELFSKLREIKNQGVSILLIEQNVKQGLKVVERGYILENGKIVLEDSSTNLVNNDHIRKAYLGL
ncbi:MAG: ABC transporter related [Thermotoga sp. 50_1627]|uniref:ABC transporter ATP-binding protein n=1 Tax=Pseudothermotoga sp. TaxID=2033661 RepID=UPI00076C6A37|nr:MAG: ABC transporter related [Thermotoga sp. 50_64]KUK24359.1 MAG: ABC transporter related [Thermotoga sp. 50_1627]MBC7115713.1 ABC transporter ATP-binding protein [Pseudothermotoga sp.]MDK2923421.1 branched-chain amino acid transport system ATP-binding protein [Pseudothermotoga sp.]HCO97694.1 branched-chain amino acid ABC transporter ATP-binding protein [Pseudothermotoga sp.]